MPESSRGDTSNGEDVADRTPSYNDPEKKIFGCEHYKRNCKVRAACCGKLFPCRFCHDKVSDHSMDRQEFYLPPHFLAELDIFCPNLFYKAPICLTVSSLLQESNSRNDVYALLGDSTGWTHLYDSFMQWIFNGKVLLQYMQIF